MQSSVSIDGLGCVELVVVLEYEVVDLAQASGSAGFKAEGTENARLKV